MIRIKNTLRQDSATTELDDVLKIKNALLKAGNYDIPEYGLTPYPDNALFQGIKEFQKKNALKVDGVITPEGETIKALSKFDNDLEDDLPGVRSPTIWCPKCGGPHGGSAGDECPDCASK